MAGTLEICVDSLISARSFPMSGETDIDSGILFRRKGVLMGIPAWLKGAFSRRMRRSFVQHG